MPANNQPATIKTIKTMNLKERNDAKLANTSGVGQTENNRKMLPGCLLREALTPDQ